MSVARHNVAELWGRTQGTFAPGSGSPGSGGAAARAGATGANALVRTGETSGDLVTWVERSGVAPGKLVGGGLLLAIAGAIGAFLLPGVGFFGTVALGSMFTLGGGLAFLGMRKLAASPPQTALPPALPPSKQALQIERSRRLRPVLEAGPATFERIAGTLRWTETAVLETLVFMKEAGAVVEDLDLDTGEWIYRLQENDYGTAEGMTLEERRARAVDRENME